MSPAQLSTNSRTLLIANHLMPQTEGGWLWTTAWWIMKLWPTQRGKESNLLSHLQYKLRLRMTPPGREPSPRGQRCHAIRQVVNKSSLISLSNPDYLEVKGQLVWNVDLNWKIECVNKEFKFGWSKVNEKSLQNVIDDNSILYSMCSLQNGRVWVVVYPSLVNRLRMHLVFTWTT